MDADFINENNIIQNSENIVDEKDKIEEIFIK